MYSQRKFNIYLMFIMKGEPIEKKFNYFYKITNLINNHYYYGVRSCNCCPEDDPYMGSGKRLHKAYSKYGIENFDKIILKILPTREDVLDLEAWIVTEELVSDPNCYNMVRGGQKTPGLGMVLVKDPNGNGNILITTKEYWKNPGRYEHYNKNKILCYDLNDLRFKVVSSEEYKNFKGVRYTLDPIIEKSKKSHIGKVVIRNIHTNEFFLVDKSDPRYGSNEYLNTTKGYYHHSDETKRKLSESHKGMKTPDNSGKISVTNGVDNKFIYPHELSEISSLGYEKGYTRSEAQIIGIRDRSNSGLAAGTFRWMTNGIENIACPIDEVEEKLLSGWSIGTTSTNPRDFLKDKIAVNKDGKVKFIYKYEIDKYLSEGYNIGGSSYSNKTKGMKRINNGVKNLYVPIEELESYLSDGWNVGWTNHKKGKKGWIHVNNGEVTKFVNPEEGSQLLLEGWSKGIIR